MNNIPQHNSRHPSELLGVVAISIALCISMFVGFLAGNGELFARDSGIDICSQDLTVDQCISFRSASAAEEATFVSKWLLWVSAGSFLASTSALIALYFTYRQGQLALGVAAEANGISERNAQAQARAYVILQSVGCNLSIDSHEQIRLSAELNFHNSGLSPALRLKTLSVAHLSVHGNGGSCEEFNEGKQFDLSKSHWQQDIGAGQSWRPAGVSWSLPKGSAICKLIGQSETLKAVTVKTIFQYEDVFGRHHKETSCFQGTIEYVAPEGPYMMLERGPDDVFDQHASRRTHSLENDTPA